MSDKPVLDLKTPYTTAPAALNVPFVDVAATMFQNLMLDIRTTKVTDGTVVGPLSSIFRLGVLPGQAPCVALNTGTLVTDGKILAPFNFQYDTASNQFGAGLAFLAQDGASGPSGPSGPSDFGYIGSSG